MTVDEALHRVVRGHWLMILVSIVVSVLASIQLSRQEPDLYEAVARLQMGRELAASNVQADAASERALGIATSPGVVRAALDKVGIRADAAAFARDHIDVRRVGVSPVIEFAVTDTSPVRAASMATSITADVLQFSNLADRQPSVDRQAELQKQIDAVAKERADLIARLSRATEGAALAIQAQLSGLMATQTEYQRQLSELALEAASQSKVVVLDPVREPTVALPSDSIQKAVLAALLGALVGLGLAAATETVRPTLRSARSISDALDVPHLGHIPGRDITVRAATAAAGRVADRVALLGRRHDTDKVFLVPVRENDNHWAHLVAGSMLPGGPGTQHRLDCAVLDCDWVDPGPTPAAVIVSPRSIRAKELKPALRVIETLGWPVLGLLTHEPAKRERRRGSGPEASSLAGEGAVVAAAGPSDDADAGAAGSASTDRASVPDSTGRPPAVDSLPAADLPAADLLAAEVPAAEVPAPQVTAPEVPAAEVPGPEVPAPEVRAGEAPAAEVPARDLPAAEAPAADVPAAEAPARDLPGPEVPEPAIPALEVKAAEVPESEVPESEAPAREVQAAKAPAAEVPAREVKAAEAPAAEEPAADVPADVPTPEVAARKASSPRASARKASPSQASARKASPSQESARKVPARRVSPRKVAARNDSGRNDWGRNDSGRNDSGRNDLGRNDSGHKDPARVDAAADGSTANQAGDVTAGAGVSQGDRP